MRQIILSVGSLMVLGGMLVSGTRAGEGEVKPDDEAMRLAVKITEEGAATYNTLNAKAMAESYLEEGKIVLITKDSNGVALKEFAGREDIEKQYTNLFKNAGTIVSKNHVEHAKLISPEVLVINGTFDTNQLKTDAPKVPFHQVRVKKGDRWLILTVEIIVAAPAEK